jgi:hypothetical protein
MNQIYQSCSEYRVIQRKVLLSCDLIKKESKLSQKNK